MGSVFLDISMSLDGFIAGRDDVVQPLHEWIVDFQTGIFKKSEVMSELFERTGAIVAGRRVYEIASGWGGNHPIRGVPVFVLSHDLPENVPQGGTPFTFVSEGIEAAIREAKAAAGDKDVYVLGGAAVAQQCLQASLLDEIQVHIAPVLLTEGIRLFDHIGSERIRLETNRILESQGITHLQYRIAKSE
ncbi:dihydrofolate reductase family protein [Cohnella nanjingensis]|uniref:Dihydrofolate reductase family protein n=1 Tax=Cohnella nanjingensis TaxID=1387779 RepID=A0A7X0VF69_9BACL|nr:dihydrofolate reductase family protein [Cohnella nanjingensis]MBB6670973.1 dihydrofolate reductase family protein [Cohnella nanjingensis]